MEDKEYKRFTISLPPELYKKFEIFRGESSRSDVIRKAMHYYMVHEEEGQEFTGDVVGCISMIISHEHISIDEENDHHEHSHEHDHHHDHEYSKTFYPNVQQADLLRANDIQHHFEDIIISNLHVHLEFEKCMEIIAVSGPFTRVNQLKKSLQKLKSIISLEAFYVDKQEKEKVE